MGKVWETGAVQVVQHAESLACDAHPRNRLPGACAAVGAGWPSGGGWAACPGCTERRACVTCSAAGEPLRPAQPPMLDPPPNAR